MKVTNPVIPPFKTFSESNASNPTPKKTQKELKGEFKNAFADVLITNGAGKIKAQTEGSEEG
jgi:hypothetical protein